MLTLLFLFQARASAYIPAQKVRSRQVLQEKLAGMPFQPTQKEILSQILSQKISEPTE
jgi:hypothetical protein